MTQQAPTGAPDQHDDDDTWTAENFARSTGPEALPPEVLANFPNTAKRIGRPPSENRKVAVNLRVDPDVLDAFKATGAGWQTRMNRVLREAAFPSMVEAQRAAAQATGAIAETLERSAAVLARASDTGRFGLEPPAAAGAEETPKRRPKLAR